MLQRFRSAYRCVNISPTESSLAHENIVSGGGVLSREQVSAIKEQAQRAIKQKYDAVICTAGGFNGSLR